jgi:hypothetical protein
MGSSSFIDFFPQVQKTTMSRDLGSSSSSVVFYSCCTQRHHVSCPRFNVIIKKIPL